MRFLFLDSDRRQLSDWHRSSSPMNETDVFHFFSFLKALAKQWISDLWFMFCIANANPKAKSYFVQSISFLFSVSICGIHIEMHLYLLLLSVIKIIIIIMWHVAGADRCSMHQFGQIISNLLSRSLAVVHRMCNHKTNQSLSFDAPASHYINLIHITFRSRRRRWRWRRKSVENLDSLSSESL